jgi:molybdenum cofactor cytidylyltransferase
MKLRQAFDIIRGDVVAFIGAGGKTSTMVGLGYELKEMGWRVIATTTTRIGDDQLCLIPYAMPFDSGASAISLALTRHGFVFLYDTIEDGKAQGLKSEWISQLMDTVDSDVMLVEADGARGLPFKAPFVHEPVIPPETSLVVPIASLEVIGKPLDEHHVYNPEAMTDRYGFPAGGRVKSLWVAQVLRDKKLGLRGVPQSPRVVAYLNQTPGRGFGRVRARLIAQLMLREARFSGVAVGSAHEVTDPVYELQRPVGAVVLAAGLSTRMGKPKVLLPWENGKRIIEHIVWQLNNARMNNIVVVTGHLSKEVKALVKPLEVETVFNRSYRNGDMLSSLKVGLNAMPDSVSACFIVLGDQPQINPKVIQQILMAYAEGKGDIIAPSYNKRRGHPILVGRRYWPELMNLPRGGAPRDVINAHNDEIHYINVDTDSVLRDIDTPQDYEDARRRGGL